jgi:zinc transport system ATP-binding protein
VGGAPARPGSDTSKRNALEVRNLTVAFGPRRIVDNVSFSVAHGSALAIIGPNASGKTVLFRALIGAVPSTGEVRWAPGTRIGYVPQKIDIDRDLPLTGIDFLRAKAQVRHTPREDIERTLHRVDLPISAAQQMIGTLSSGQFQRLLVAFALLDAPTILLIDEPTAGVDDPGQQGIYALLRTLQKEDGLTILLISHELSVVYRYSDNVLCMSRSHYYFGPPVEVLTPERLQEIYGAPVRFHDHHTQ